MKVSDAPTFFNSELLKQLRENMGKTQHDFAKICKVGQVQLSRYENGSAVPKAATVKRITQNLGLTPDYFWTAQIRVGLAQAREAFLKDLETIKNSNLNADQINAMHSVVKMVLITLNMQKVLS